MVEYCLFIGGYTMGWKDFFVDGFVGGGFAIRKAWSCLPGTDDFDLGKNIWRNSQ